MLLQKWSINGIILKTMQWQLCPKNGTYLFKLHFKNYIFNCYSSSGYLEGDDSDGEGGVSIAAIKMKFKKNRRGGMYKV